MDTRNIPPAGFPIGLWCASVGFGRTTFYALPPPLKPRTVKIGERTIIIESPADYLERIAAEQQGATIPKARA